MQNFLADLALPKLFFSGVISLKNFKIFGDLKFLKYSNMLISHERLKFNQTIHHMKALGTLISKIHIKLQYFEKFQNLAGVQKNFNRKHQFFVPMCRKLNTDDPSSIFLVI